MLCAKRKSDQQSAIASSESKLNGPFLCPECDNEVVLKIGSVRLNHFVHKSSNNCEYGKGETDAHRRCKIAIYEALLREPNVKKAALERSLKTCRPDVSAYINGVPVVEFKSARFPWKQSFVGQQNMRAKEFMCFGCFNGHRISMAPATALAFGKSGFMRHISEAFIAGSKG